MKHLRVLCFFEVWPCSQALSHHIMPLISLMGATKQLFSQTLGWLWSLEEHLLAPEEAKCKTRATNIQEDSYLLPINGARLLYMRYIGATGTI